MLCQIINALIKYKAPKSFAFIVTGGENYDMRLAITLMALPLGVEPRFARSERYGVRVRRFAIKLREINSVCEWFFKTHQRKEKNKKKVKNTQIKSAIQ